MNREIIFRVWDKFEKKMRTNDMTIRISVNSDGSLNSMGIVGVNPIMQHIGLKDKSGKEIYEGDILKFYSLERSIQQSHPDINPEIDTCIIRENIDTVIFNEGAFRLKDLIFDYIGLWDIDQIKDACGCVDDETCDINGNEINDTVLGIEVIGNIYENPELLN